MPNGEIRTGRVLVIGLDGATFDLLLPWMEQGHLPHLADIWSHGNYGHLRSTIPPITASAWASFQTGKNPGKHGLFDFTRYQQGSYSTPLVNATVLESKTIWQILSDHGRRVGVINVPLTYPPSPVNGFMISGMLTPEPAKAFYPPELYEELLSEVGDYQVFTPVRSFDYLGVKHFVDRVTDLARKRTEAALFLQGREEWDFFMVHFQSTDILQHALWAWMDPAHDDFANKSDQDRSYVMGFYRDLDDMIGRLQQCIGDEGTLIVLSDHGFGPVTKRVFINQWLMNEGLLTPKGSSLRRRLLGLAQSGIRKVDFLKMRRRLIRPMGRTERLVKYVLQDALIDWSRTKAFALSGSMMARIYLNCAGREPEGIVEWGMERETLRDDIINRLMEMKDPATGQRAIKHVYKREEIYHGSLLESMPDLIVEPAEGYMIAAEFRKDVLIEPVPQFMSGAHRMDGVLMMKGRPFVKGTQLQGAEIIDLAPTILYLMGEPIPTDMDGKVLTAGLEPSYREAYPVQYEEVETDTGQVGQEVYSPEDAEDIRERLAGLGYLD